MRPASAIPSVIGSRVLFRGWIFLLSIWLSTAQTAFGLQKEAHSYKTVVIDAGHGGKDPGTVVGRAKEKTIVLDVALKLGKLIRQNQKNVRVIFTRDGDYYVPLMDRAQIANKANADLFISIHANYCDSPSIYGTETYVLGLHRSEDNLNVAKKENSVILLEDDYTTRYEGFNPNLSESYIMFELIQDTYLDQSLRFASVLQSNFRKQALRHDREVRQAGFLVLRETAMPSVLIETGYLSNKKENSYLLSDAGRNEIAESIYGSLTSYLSKIDAKDNIAIQSKNDSSPKNTNSTVSETTKSSRKAKTFSPAPKNGKTDSKPVAAPKQKEIRETNAGKNDSDKMTYAIQIGVFSKRIGSDSKLFKGLAPVRELVKDGRYKYVCFESETFKGARANFAKVSRIFPDAFVVSVKNNQTRMVWDGKSKK